jgi:hypothetical protein
MDQPGKFFVLEPKQVMDSIGMRTSDSSGTKTESIGAPVALQQTGSNANFVGQNTRAETSGASSSFVTNRQPELVKYDSAPSREPKIDPKLETKEAKVDQRPELGKPEAKPSESAKGELKPEPRSQAEVQKGNSPISSATSSPRSAAGVVASTIDQQSLARTTLEAKISPHLSPPVKGEGIVRGEERREAGKPAAKPTEGAVVDKKVEAPRAKDQERAVTQPAPRVETVRASAPRTQPAPVQQYVQPQQQVQAARVARVAAPVVNASAAPRTISAGPRGSAGGAVITPNSITQNRAPLQNRTPVVSSQALNTTRQITRGGDPLVGLKAAAALRIAPTQGAARQIVKGAELTVTGATAAGVRTSTALPLPLKAGNPSAGALPISKLPGATPAARTATAPLSRDVARRAPGQQEAALGIKGERPTLNPAVKGVVQGVVTRNKLGETLAKPVANDAKPLATVRLTKGVEVAGAIKPVSGVSPASGSTIRKEVSAALREAVKVVNAIEGKQSRREAAADKGLHRRPEGPQGEIARKRQPTLRPNQNQEVQKALEQIRAILSQLDADQRVAALAMLESGSDLKEDRVLGSLEDFGITSVLEDDTLDDGREDEETLEEVSAAPVIDGEGTDVDQEGSGAGTSSGPKAQLDLDIMGEGGVPAEGTPERFMAYLSLEHMRFPHSNFALAV